MRGLLPCPFCGWAAIMREWTSGMHYYRAECSNTEGCDCHGLQHLTLGEAIAAWNRRAGNDTNVATNNAVPVVRGEWMPIFKGADTCKCSVCKRKGVSDSDYGFIATPFCPNCGAKMEDKPCE